MIIIINIFHVSTPSKFFSHCLDCIKWLLSIAKPLGGKLGSFDTMWAVDYFQQITEWFGIDCMVSKYL